MIKKNTCGLTFAICELILVTPPVPSILTFLINCNDYEQTSDSLFSILHVENIFCMQNKNDTTYIIYIVYEDTTYIIYIVYKDTYK